MKNTVYEVRAFNRFYTSHLDILNQSYLNSSYTLTEVRIIYEISEYQTITAQKICEILNLDKGYLSRILKRFLKDQLIEKISSLKDRRAFNIKLTFLGNKLLEQLNTIAEKQTAEKVDKLSIAEKAKLTESMNNIKMILGKNSNERLSSNDVSFRHDIRPGDIGYIIYLHSIIYGKESTFSNEFELYVIKTFYKFLEKYSPENDRLWIAEYNSKIIGCIAIVHNTEDQAQLRWFLSDPSFRGLGIGKKLLNTAIKFCREKKFKTVFLLTTNMQEQAVKMYKTVGFELTQSKEVNQWGTSFRDERYDLKLL